MAKLSLNIDTRSERNGMVPVRLRINHKATSAFVPTGVKVEPQYFIAGSLYDPIHRKAYMAVEKREQIARLVKRFEEYLLEVDRNELAQLTANEIKERVCGTHKADGAIGGNTNMSGKRLSASVGLHTSDMSGFGGLGGRLVGKGKKSLQSGDFVAFYEQYGESRRSEKTRESYEYGAKLLRAYCKERGLLTLTFIDIDYSRLVDYARWLTDSGKGAATRHMMESYVRAAYRDAQKRRLVSRDLDPYFDYKIERVPLKDIECLTAKQMKRLMTCEPKLGGLQMGRDVALMSFYLCGHNLIDLYEMGLPKNGVCEFVRHKIEHRYQREVRIHIEPELKTLVDKYKGDKMLLSFKATYPNYTSFRHKIAHRLRELSTELGFEVSMPRIRRTWATIAAEIDCPPDIINKSMGHVDKTVNDISYVEYKWWKTAKWNRRVIDYILKQNTPK